MKAELPVRAVREGLVVRDEDEGLAVLVAQRPEKAVEVLARGFV
jgi:hypothetical protein